MSYSVLKSGSKNKVWRLNYRQSVGSVRISRHIPESSYLNIGFHPSMTIEQAKERAKQLNAQKELKRRQEKRNSIDSRFKEESLKLNASLPEYLVKEFELLYIDNNTSKKVIHWRTTKKIMVDLSIPLEDWSFHKEKFYRYFEARNYSYDYVQKLLYMFNKWGQFVSYKQKSFFTRIPLPRSTEKERINDNHFQEKGSTKSEALTIQLLQSKKHLFNEVNYNWLYLTLWCGLRPIECDNLLKAPSKTTWELLVDDVNGINVLWVYQSKLTGIPKNKRLKPIPFKYVEQEKCIAIINSKQFKRPLNKTIKKHFNGQYTCYTGRKGFVDLMLERGFSLESISQWLGHSNINRTWSTYKDKNKVLLK